MNNEKEFTEAEKRDAEKAVNRMMDGGKFEATVKEFSDKMLDLVQNDKEDSAFIVMVRNGKLGMTTAGVCGSELNILIMLDDFCGDNPAFFDCLRRFVLGRQLKNMLGGKPGGQKN